MHAKESAARWALPLLTEEHRPALKRALAIYRGEAEDLLDDTRPTLRPDADYLVAQLERARSRRSP